MRPTTQVLDAALHSIYHHPDPMGNPHDIDFVFANFSSPQRPSPAARKIVKRRKPVTPGRTTIELDYNGQIFVRARQPAPAMSVASMSTRVASIQKLQPVAIELPLPTVRYGFTNRLSRRTTIHPFQERE